jgi:hypothetical protein
LLPDLKVPRQCLIVLLVKEGYRRESVGECSIFVSRQQHLQVLVVVVVIIIIIIIINEEFGMEFEEGIYCSEV